MPSEAKTEPQFDARFSDGRTAASLAVRVMLSGDSLSIDTGDGMPPLRWHLTQVETAEPITASATDCLVHEPGRKGATLFVPEGLFVRELATRAPHLTARVQRWRYAKPWAIASAVIVGTVAILTTTEISPARTIAGMLPDKTRQALGREVVRSMGRGQQACESVAGKAALAQLAQRLSQATGSTRSFSVSVVDSPVVNAFAAPGEQIVIMRGLLAKAESADEVAGVLAHEMGHGLELHPESAIVRVLGLTAIMEFMLGGSGGTIANLGLLLTNLSYTRQGEREADAQALRVLKQAGIASRGFSDFFRRMAKTESDRKQDKSPDPVDATFNMLRSHPSLSERLAVVEAQPVYPATPALSQSEWLDLKSICGPLASTQRPAKRVEPDSAPRKRPDATRPAPPSNPGGTRSPRDAGREI
jgi:beta-barrel assembly-enhancing protease